MKFTLSADGAQAAGQGIGNILKAYVLGPQMRQQAEQDAMKTASDIYYRRMAGDKYGAEAGKLGQETEGLRLTNAARTGPIDTTLPANLQTAFKLFQATGDNNMERFANAGTALQTQSIRDQAVAAVDNLDRMNRLNTLAKPGETYMPFDNVGESGYSINQATGQQVEANPVIAKIFQQVEGALANQRNAAAGASGAAGALSNARRARVESGLDKLVTVQDDNGGATIMAVPTQGDMRTVGTAVPKGTGVDATNAKTRNAIIAAVERDLPGSDEATIMAEVEKRLARRGISTNKNPAGAAGQPKIPQPGKFKSPDEVKAAFKAGQMSREEAMAILQRDFGMK